MEVHEGKDYERVEMISQGGMGEVWSCRILEGALVTRSKGANSCVAKVSKATEKSTENRQAFKQEVSLSFHIQDHPNLAQTIGFCHEPPSILMEYYPMGSLSGLLHSLTKEFPWTPERKWSVARDIACGLRHMHQLMVAHCDIKPDNVLIQANNDGPRMITAVLTDFGIAHILDGKKNVVATFETKNIDGLSFRYAAPEALIRMKQRTHLFGDAGMMKASDVYSLAMVTFEMLVRKKPWAW